MTIVDTCHEIRPVASALSENVKIRIWSDHTFLNTHGVGLHARLDTKNKQNTNTQIQMQGPVWGICRVWSDHTFLKYWRCDLLQKTQTKL